MKRGADMAKISAASRRPGCQLARRDFSLPLTDERPALVAEAEPTAPVPTGSERVLIVEDDPAVLSGCLDMLNGLGYRCEVAIDAAGALARLRSDASFDILFSDVVMPGGVNGIELARQAQRLKPSLRILLTSGYVGESALEEVHDFEVIAKPYRNSELAERLRAVMTQPAAGTAAIGT